MDGGGDRRNIGAGGDGEGEGGNGGGANGGYLGQNGDS